MPTSPFLWELEILALCDSNHPTKKCISDTSYNCNQLRLRALTSIKQAKAQVWEVRSQPSEQWTTTGYPSVIHLAIKADVSRTPLICFSHPEFASSVMKLNVRKMIVEKVCHEYDHSSFVKVTFPLKEWPNHIPKCCKRCAEDSSASHECFECLWTSISCFCSIFHSRGLSQRLGWP